ncbi:hypothetical protein QCN27_13915 [Cereibacter sp. SYSU M97828]|nr:hypothetical protein [Cereibacter flavus]
MTRRSSFLFQDLPEDFCAALRSMEHVDFTERQLAPDILLRVQACVLRFAKYCTDRNMAVGMSSQAIHAYLLHIHHSAIKNISKKVYLQFFGYFAAAYGVADADLEKIAKLRRFHRNAARSDPKRKVILLAAHPMTLDQIFNLAVAELQRGLLESVPVKKERCFFLAAICALLSREQMRRKDALAIEIGKNFVLNGASWAFDYRSSKTGYVALVDIPDCLNVFIDRLLDPSGELDRDLIYVSSIGRPLFSYDGKTPCQPEAFSYAFKKVVGHSPHIVRTLVHTELAMAGLAGDHALALCGQSRSGVSRDDYEVGMAPHRITTAMAALDKIRFDLAKGTG